jgi:hypothetical protein
MLSVLLCLRRFWRIGAFEKIMNTDMHMNEYDCAYDLVSLLGACLLLSEHLICFSGGHR